MCQNTPMRLSYGKQGLPQSLLDEVSVEYTSADNSNFKTTYDLESSIIMGDKIKLSESKDFTVRSITLSFYVYCLDYLFL